jgi:hypothetical protein
MGKSQLEYLTRRMAELAERHEGMKREVLGNPHIPQEFKDFVRGRDVNLEEERVRDEFERKLNEGRRITGWDPETFKPIYEKGERNG